MTVTEILRQARTLSPQERKELVILLVDSLDVDKTTHNGSITTPKTGAEIAAMLEQMEPIEFVDPEITDPVEWVKAQREKERKRRLGDWGKEE